MDQKIQWAVNHMPKTDDKNLPIMGLEEIGKARTFHESFPQYSKTPLTKLDHMAEYLGVKEIYLKDESYRFGLNAFKVLGGSFAMARYIASETGKDVSELPYSCLLYTSAGFNRLPVHHDCTCAAGALAASVLYRMQVKVLTQITQKRFILTGAAHHSIYRKTIVLSHLYLLPLRSSVK